MHMSMADRAPIHKTVHISSVGLLLVEGGAAVGVAKLACRWFKEDEVKGLSQSH